MILMARNLDLMALRWSSVIVFDGDPSTIVYILDLLWKPSKSLFCKIAIS